MAVNIWVRLKLLNYFGAWLINNQYNPKSETAFKKSSKLTGFTT
jgi:hypothetical protein